MQGSRAVVDEIFEEFEACAGMGEMRIVDDQACLGAGIAYLRDQHRKSNNWLQIAGNSRVNA